MSLDRVLVAVVVSGHCEGVTNPHAPKGTEDSRDGIYFRGRVICRSGVGLLRGVGTGLHTPYLVCARECLRDPRSFSQKIT